MDILAVNPLLIQGSSVQDMLVHAVSAAIHNPDNSVAAVNLAVVRSSQGKDRGAGIGGRLQRDCNLFLVLINYAFARLVVVVYVRIARPEVLLSSTFRVV